MPEGPFGFPRPTGVLPFTKVRAPVPTFATHGTEVRQAKSIIDSGEIQTSVAATIQKEDRVVSMSLDGVFTLGSVFFVIPVSTLKGKYDVSPDFYYSISSVARTIQEEDYRIAPWDWYTSTTEVQIKENIKLEDIQSVYIDYSNIRPEQRDIVEEIEESELNIIERPESSLRDDFCEKAQQITIDDYPNVMFQTEPPTGVMKDMTLAYNNMVADLFDIDISRIENRASIEYRKNDVDIWW